MKTNSEVVPNYGNNDDIVEQAKQVIKDRLRKPGKAIFRSTDAADLCILELAEEKVEHLLVLYVDAQYRLIHSSVLCSGTITANTIYPRELIKNVLHWEAAAIILAHNHPSGSLEPSHADKDLTKKLTKACSTIDVKLLDHIIVGGVDYYSFSDNGEM